jgi:hypothetical protein
MLREPSSLARDFVMASIDAGFEAKGNRIKREWPFLSPPYLDLTRIELIILKKEIK